MEYKISGVIKKRGFSYYQDFKSSSGGENGVDNDSVDDLLPIIINNIVVEKLEGVLYLNFEDLAGAIIGGGLFSIFGDTFLGQVRGVFKSAKLNLTTKMAFDVESVILANGELYVRVYKLIKILFIVLLNKILRKINEEEKEDV